MLQSFKKGKKAEKENLEQIFGRNVSTSQFAALS